MITIQIPTFDEFNNYKFVKFVKVKVKNKMDSKDYGKITKLLPGVPQGYCGKIYTIAKTKKPIDVTSFYDIRQNRKILRIMKGNFITVLN